MAFSSTEECNPTGTIKIFHSVIRAVFLEDFLRLFLCE